MLGLSLLSTQRRIREIGIRRVNGAETREIVNMLNWDFMKWIILSFVLAIPIAYLALDKWLANYAYKTASQLVDFCLCRSAGHGDSPFNRFGAILESIKQKSG